MGFVYLRGGRWWLSYTDAAGQRVRESSGSNDEKFAKKVLAGLERQVDAELRARGGEQVLTVAAFAEVFLADRTARGVMNVKDERQRLTTYALPVLGHLALEEVRRADVLALVRKLEADRHLSARSIRHVYADLRGLFNEALARDILKKASPCTLTAKRGELPKRRDVDPTWRSKAVFTRAEAESLMSDERLPEDHRVLWGFLFFTGQRIGEALDRRWRDIDPVMEPLAKLLVSSSWHSKKKVSKATKTEAPRAVPVHRTLAQLLARWRLAGWQRHVGRAPRADDLILPRPDGHHRISQSALKQLHRDCKVLGLRPRRQHDIRRTFITLARADGASKDTLRWITHGPDGEIMDEYTTLPWPALCAEVEKLNLSLRGGEVVRLAVGVTPVAQADCGDEKAPKIQHLGGLWTERRTGFEEVREASPDVTAVGTSDACATPDVASDSDEPPSCDSDGTAADPSGYLALARRSGLQVVR
jgi:integrase